MAAGRIWNLDWLNSNRQRSYPISEDSSMRDVTDSISVPDDLITDFVFSVPHIESGNAYVAPGLFHVLSIAVFSAGSVITLGYNGAPCGIVSVTFASHVRDTPYAVSGQGDFFDARGVMVVGSVDTLISNASAGMYVFDLSAMRFEPCTIRPGLRGVSGLRVVNGRDVSDPMYGDIYLTAGKNIRLVKVDATTIRIDAVSSPSQLSLCSCSNMPTAASPIKTINGLSSDVDGNFVLAGGACLQITQDGQNGLKFGDTCSTPCCGCKELDVIRSDMSRVEQEAASVLSVARTMSSEVEKLKSSILSSQLGRGQIS